MSADRVAYPRAHSVPIWFHNAPYLRQSRDLPRLWTALLFRVPRLRCVVAFSGITLCRSSWSIYSGALRRLSAPCGATVRVRWGSSGAATPPHEASAVGRVAYPVGLARCAPPICSRMAALRIAARGAPNIISVATRCTRTVPLWAVGPFYQPPGSGQFVLLIAPLLRFALHTFWTNPLLRRRVVLQVSTFLLRGVGPLSGSFP
jgi:hypothetical protein